MFHGQSEHKDEENDASLPNVDNRKATVNGSNRKNLKRSFNDCNDVNVLSIRTSKDKNEEEENETKSNGDMVDDLSEDDHSSPPRKRRRTQSTVNHKNKEQEFEAARDKTPSLSLSTDTSMIDTMNNKQNIVNNNNNNENSNTNSNNTSPKSMKSRTSSTSARSKQSKKSKNKSKKKQKYNQFQTPTAKAANGHFFAQFKIVEKIIVKIADEKQDKQFPQNKELELKIDSLCPSNEDGEKTSNNNSNNRGNDKSKSWKSIEKCRKLKYSEIDSMFINVIDTQILSSSDSENENGNENKNENKNKNGNENNNENGNKNESEKKEIIDVDEQKLFLKKKEYLFEDPMISSDIWISLKDLLRFLSYSPKSAQFRHAQGQYLTSISKFLTDNGVDLQQEDYVRYYKQRYFISECGFCLLVSFLQSHEPDNNMIQHLLRFRFQYRSLLFNRDFGESFDMTSPCDEKEPWQYSCYLCGLEDFSNRFVHYCDCGVQFHTRCSKARNLFVPSHESLCTQEEIKLYHDNWFCLYCINYASKICQYGRERLMKRRLQADGPEGEYEVDEVMSHDPNFEFYCVRWKYYPPQATSRIQFDASYAQKIDYYWGEWEKANGRKRCVKVRKQLKEALRESDNDDDSKSKKKSNKVNNSTKKNKKKKSNKSKNEKNKKKSKKKKKRSTNTNQKRRMRMSSESDSSDSSSSSDDESDDSDDSSDGLNGSVEVIDNSLLKMSIGSKSNALSLNKNGNVINEVNDNDNNGNGDGDDKFAKWRHLFIPVKLSDIMDKDKITQRQRYDKHSARIRTQFMQNKLKALTLIRNQKKRTKTGNRLRQNKSLLTFYLETKHKQWDVTSKRNREQISQHYHKFYSKHQNNSTKEDNNDNNDSNESNGENDNGNSNNNSNSDCSENENVNNNDKSMHNVSEWGCASNCYVIGEIVDENNPAAKYASDGIHNGKAYGLFAIEAIKKGTLLFEYAGVVRRTKEAEEALDHLEHEMDQTTLFTLQGHCRRDTEFNVWGDKENDRLEVDPHLYHNEAVYMNDYRDDITADADDDEDCNQNQFNIYNSNKSSKQKQKHNENRNQTARKGRQSSKSKSKAKRKKRNSKTKDIIKCVSPTALVQETEQLSEYMSRNAKKKNDVDSNNDDDNNNSKNDKNDKNEDKKKDSDDDIDAVETSRKIVLSSDSSSTDIEDENENENDNDASDDDDDESSEEGISFGCENKKKSLKDEQETEGLGMVPSLSGRTMCIKFVETLINGWPHIFGVASRDIEPGSELLGDYGFSYWKNYRIMLKRRIQLNQIKAKEAQRAAKEATNKTANLMWKTIEPMLTQDQIPQIVQALSSIDELSGLQLNQSKQVNIEENDDEQDTTGEGGANLNNNDNGNDNSNENEDESGNESDRYSISVPLAQSDQENGDNNNSDDKHNGGSGKDEIDDVDVEM